MANVTRVNRGNVRMTDPDRMQGTQMSPEAVDQLLTERGWGILSLAAGRDAHAVPLSFGYDGDRCYLYLIQFGPDSEKLEAIERTRTAALSVVHVEDASTWYSVVARGQLYPVDEDGIEAFETAMTDNGWFPNLFPAEDDLRGVHRYVLEIEERTGRRGA